MYIFEYAFRNVLRNKGRNILLGLIIFVVIVSSVVTLMINNTTSSIIEDYKNRFGSEVILSVNMEKLREEAMKNSEGGKVLIRPPSISAEQYLAFGDSEYLMGSEYFTSKGVNGEGLTAVDEELGGGIDGPIMKGIGVDYEPTKYYFNLKAGWGEDFTNGLRSIAEGRYPENENEVIVSTDFAELNGLSVGDTMKLQSNLSDPELEITDSNRDVPISYEVTIVGTYYDATDEYADGQQKNAFTNRRNEILTMFETVVAPLQEGLSGIKVSATYYLKNPEFLDEFAEELYAKGLDPIYDVKTDEASYNKIVGPVEGLRSISITFMLIVLLFGGVIIALLTSIAIRERKYEIGVLRAMGMKKHKVVIGLWAEMLIITTVCLGLGLGIGTLTAQPVTNLLLDRQIEAAEASANNPSLVGGMMIGR